MERCGAARPGPRHAGLRAVAPLAGSVARLPRAARWQLRAAGRSHPAASCPYRPASGSDSSSASSQCGTFGSHGSSKDTPQEQQGHTTAAARAHPTATAGTAATAATAGTAGIAATAAARLGVHARLLEGVPQVLGLRGRLRPPPNHADGLDALECLRQLGVLVAAAAVGRGREEGAAAAGGRAAGTGCGTRRRYDQASGGCGHITAVPLLQCSLNLVDAGPAMPASRAISRQLQLPNCGCWAAAGGGCGCRYPPTAPQP